MIVITDPKTFDFDFGWPKDVDENLKHKFEFIIKSNASLTENKIKNGTEELLSKKKHGNNIHEHGKQQKHGHKKRKDSLEGCLVRVLFSAELEFLKMIVPRLP